MFYWYDSGYFLFVLPAFFFALWAQGKVRAAYQMYSRVYAASGRPAYEVAANLLRHAGLGDVRIQRVPGELRDHYDPRNRTLSLSDGTYNSTSVAALAIAATRGCDTRWAAPCGLPPLALINKPSSPCQHRVKPGFPCSSWG